MLFLQTISSDTGLSSHSPDNCFQPLDPKADCDLEQKLQGVFTHGTTLSYVAAVKVIMQPVVTKGKLCIYFHFLCSLHTYTFVV